MSEKLVVQNFGSIRSAELDLRRFMVLIGQQATGKSTIAKLLAIFRSPDFINEEKNHDSHFKKYNILNYFSPETYFKFIHPEYAITYQNKSWQIDISDSLKDKILNEKKRIRDYFSALLLESYKTQSPPPNDQQKEVQLNQINDANWKNFFSILPKSIYVPAERILISAIEQASFGLRNIALPQNLIDFGQQFELSRQAIGEFPIDFLNIRFKIEQGKNKVYLDESHSLLLSETASGFQTAIPLAVVVEHLYRSNGKYNFMVEEPELSLFPFSQKGIINFLIPRCVTKTGNELIITTHTPYVLSVANNLLFAFQVARKYPEKMEEISQIVPQLAWIDPNDFNAYYLSDGSAKSIFDTRTQLISENELDNVSEDIGGEYDSLMDIYKGNS